MRYLLLDRSPSSPLAVTLSSEGVWRRSDETGGERVTNFELELKLNADLELIKNRLYLAANLLYEPEATHDPDHIGAGWEKELTGGISGAISVSHVPAVFVAPEVWYFATTMGSGSIASPATLFMSGPRFTSSWAARRS